MYVVFFLLCLVLCLNIMCKLIIINVFFSVKIYPIKDKSTDRKRLALLINNVEFKNLSDRTGANKDELSMEVLLKGLGYTVITLRDLSAQVHSSVFKPNKPTFFVVVIFDLDGLVFRVCLLLCETSPSERNTLNRTAALWC